MSQVTYFGAHSLKIGKMDTWKDWHLIPCSRPDFADAEPRLVFIEIPGADGEIDASKALSGRVLFEMREGSFEFWVDNERDEKWDQLYTRMKNYVQARELKVVKTDDPLWYYIGYFWFSDPTQDNTNMKVILNYKVKPYKYKNYDSLTDIPWDDLTLDDVVQHYVFKDISVSGERTCEFKANTIGRAAVVPTFIAETDGEGLSIKLVNPELSISTERSLGNGKTTDPNFILSGINEENVCSLTISGNGKLSIQFVSGEL
jgi:hypothetical protein